MQNYTPNDIMPANRLSEDGIILWKGTATNLEELHTHEFIEMAYIYSGKGVHIINGTSYSVSRGNLLFINYKQTHMFKPVNKMTYCNILMMPDFISSELINSENALDMLLLSTFQEFSVGIKRITPFINFSGNDMLQIEGLIDEMLVEYENKQIGYRSALRSLLTMVLIKSFRKMHADDNAQILQQTGKLTPELLQYIEKNCFDKISISELARKCFYNPAYFSRIFKENYGMTLTDFVQQKRIEKACELLETSDLTIDAISAYVGYNERKQFYNTFRKYADNMTPGDYRK